MTVKAYEVVLVEGLQHSSWQAVAFLRCADKNVNALPVFGRLSRNNDMELRTRFDCWIGGVHHKQWFHGWDDPRYRDCFVFKSKDHRFYGFLCHPMSGTNKRFRACILCSHATKSDWNTDKKELKRAQQLLLDPAVQAAIKAAFPETEVGGTTWLN